MSLPRRRSSAKANRKAGKSQAATAILASSTDGSTYVVGISNLRVVIYRDRGVWYAQGLEIDYLADGSSLKDVQRIFEDGLAATIDANIERFEHIRHLLRSAPTRVWQRVLARGVCRRYSQVSRHSFPFKVEYLEAKVAA